MIPLPLLGTKGRLDWHLDWLRDRGRDDEAHAVECAGEPGFASPSVMARYAVVERVEALLAAARRAPGR